jgi:hypothetical protein
MLMCGFLAQFFVLHYFLKLHYYLKLYLLLLTLVNVSCLGLTT